MSTNADRAAQLEQVARRSIAAMNWAALFASFIGCWIASTLAVNDPSQFSWAILFVFFFISIAEDLMVIKHDARETHHD